MYAYAATGSSGVVFVFATAWFLCITCMCVQWDLIYPKVYLFPINVSDKPGKIVYSLAMGTHNRVSY